MHWKRRWAKSARRRRCNGLEDDGRIRNGHRLGGSCGAENEDQNLLRLSDDPDVNDAIRFLREREVVHFQRFGEAIQLLREKLDQKNVYYMNPALG